MELSPSSSYDEIDTDGNINDMNLSQENHSKALLETSKSPSIPVVRFNYFLESSLVRVYILMH